MYFRNDVRQPPGRTPERGYSEASVSLPPAHRLPVSFCDGRDTSAAAEAAESTQTYACATPQTVRATPHITLLLPKTSQQGQNRMYYRCGYSLI